MKVSTGIVFSKFKRLAPAMAPLLLALPAASSFAADITIPPLTVGAGIRSSFTDTNVSGTSEGDSDDFHLNSARIYLGGAITDNIKFSFDTEYTGDGDSTVRVIDAIGRFEFSPQVNIWAGRFLPPSDRSNLYGPYYANNFGVYQDGVQDGYPSFPAGRDNGVAYWGDFDRLKVSAGVFDVPSTTESTGGDGKKVLLAGRLQYDFWDLEPGYYLNGTYYGEKDILAIGLAEQHADGNDAYNADFLLEKKLGDKGAFTVEAEYAKYDKLGGYVPGKSDGYYGLAAYLFPQVVGIGKFQILGKYGEAKFDDADTKLKTTEVDLNYIIKSFNARLSLFYIGSDYTGSVSDVTQIGIGMQLQI